MRTRQRVSKAGATATVDAPRTASRTRNVGTEIQSQSDESSSLGLVRDDREAADADTDGGVVDRVSRVEKIL